MSEQKRDSKGRILHQGERQREDGRYEFRYKDNRGETRSIYSWKLVATDKRPKGKRDNECLRDKEKLITKDILDGVDSYNAYRISLNKFFDDYMETKLELKPSTRTNYKYMYNKYARDGIGNKNIASIKYSDIKKFYLHLIHDCGFKPASMEIMNTVLHPVFTVAVRDGVIRANPTDGAMADIKRSHDWSRDKRHALTVQEQESFVRFCRESKEYSHWSPLFTVLLGTGCRIGEITGLRWQDCDFKQRIITINHSLIYRQQEDNSGCVFHISTPKTKNSVRIIPMLTEVYNALMSERLYQMAHGGLNLTEIDGYSGFVFKNRFGDVVSPACANRAIARICRDYNAAETELAQKEKREAQLLPHFTVHNLRHTFCTRFCENETNLKIIQEIMGHADITTTMDIYNEATKEKKIESFANLDSKIKIS